MSRKSQFVVLFAITAMFCVSIVKLFGTTVSSKFSNANNSVASQVVFGGESDYQPSYQPSYQPPRQTAPAWQPPRQQVQVQVPTEVEAVSTFSIDVDTGSYTQARRSIEGGYMPAERTVRVEEFVNYFKYDYSEPPKRKTAAVMFEGAPSPFSSDGDTHLVRIGLQARGLRERVPVHVTFLIDTSGSMGGEDRLPLAKQAVRMVMQQLLPTDTIAIATYAGSSDVVLDATSARDQITIGRALDSLRAGGGTAMGSGMELAYGVASRHAGPGRVSRVIVMSDGDANIGRSRSGDILDEVRSYVDDGVTLSTVGFGTGNYNDALMEGLADAGNGNYTYIDSADEIPRAFAERLDSMLHVVAKDVKVQVEFDTDAVKSWRQVGYENRKLANHEFRDDRVDAGELGAGHQVTALYEVTLQPRVARDARLATVRFRHKDAHGSVAREASSTMLASSLRSRIGHTSDDFRFQAAVATFAERLRGQDHKNFGWIEEVASSGTAGHADRLRFVQLVRLAATLDGRM